jgi:predicted AlkP superfamily phosphohydrolase/phosphomutase
MSDRKKVLIIGLDGVSWNVLNPMIENGYMPFIQGLIKKGKNGILKSTEPPITPTAWTSFQTGVPPEVHKIMGFRNFLMKDGKLQSKILSSSSIPAKRIWDILSENNRRICLLNIPLTYPTFPVNGVLVSGFPVPSSDSMFTFPEDFKDELLKIIPDFQVMYTGIGAKQKGMKIEDIIGWWTNTVYQKANLALYLLKKESWDVFMVHFQETDLLQHYLWHCIDRVHLYHNREDFSKVAKFYSALDTKISELITKGQKKDFSVMLLSDHGFQSCRYNLKINNWLLQKGYLVLNKDLKRVFISIIKKISDLPFLYKVRFSWGDKKTTEDLINQFLKSVINYSKSSIFIESNATGIAFAHFLKQDKMLREKILSKLNSITTENGENVVEEIKKIRGSEYVYKIIFKDGVVSIGTVPDNKPLFMIPLPFDKQHIGVHHRDGIIIFDETLKHYELPKNIFDVPKIIMKLQDIPFTPLQELKKN